MRIATSTIYDAQINSIEDLSSQYQLIGQQLSTGKSLNAPGDKPSIVAQDLKLSGTIAAEQGDVSNASAAQNEMTFVDSTLASLTNILQQARSLTVASATDVIPNGAQRQDQAKQIEGMLEQAVGLANAQYGQRFIFSGTLAGTTPPITSQGNPPNAFLFTGNLQTRYETINGQSVAVGTTMQQAFNLSASDGSPSIFQVLATLRDTMNKASVVDESGQAVNAPGNYITNATTLQQLTTAPGPSLASVPLQLDNSGNLSFAINGVDPLTGNANSFTFTFPPATTVGAVVAAINAQPQLGVQATWSVADQRLVLTSVPNNGDSTFQVQDAQSAGATNTGNFLAAFHLQGQADVINNLSRQIGDVDTVLNALLKTRAELGTKMQSLAAQGTQISSLVTDNTNIKSGYEDTDVATATSRFTQLQTALQGAYAVTTRLESKTLLDYL
jgi:flagellar hook-associated protein 3 FlgL